MIYFLKCKSGTVEDTKQFLVDNASYGKIKISRSDNLFHENLYLF